jgi:hypothetical protein
VEREDRRIENVLAALPVDVLLRVAGQRGDDLDAVAGEEAGEILEPRLVQHGEIAAIDYARADLARCAPDHDAD